MVVVEWSLWSGPSNQSITSLETKVIVCPMSKGFVLDIEYSTSTMILFLESVCIISASPHENEQYYMFVIANYKLFSNEIDSEVLIT